MGCNNSQEDVDAQGSPGTPPLGNPSQHQRVSTALVLLTVFQIKAHWGLTTSLSVNATASAMIYRFAAARLTQKPCARGAVAHSTTRS